MDIDSDESQPNYDFKKFIEMDFKKLIERQDFDDIREYYETWRIQKFHSLEQKNMSHQRRNQGKRNELNT